MAAATTAARTAVLLVPILVAVAPPGGVWAQEEPDTVDTRIQEARRLREARDYGEAARRLRSYLRDHPDDPAVLRLLATSLERWGDRGGAREAYEEALRHRPGDPLLRLDYGALLVAMEEAAEARRVLGPVVQDPGVPDPVAADGHVLLGRLARAAGDDAAAEDQLRAALERSPGHAPALRLLRVMYRERSPRVEAVVDGSDDDQELGRVESGLSGSFRPLPWLRVGADIAVTALDGTGASETLVRGGAGARATWDPLGVEGGIRGGGVRRGLDDDLDWTGEGWVAYRAPAGVLVRLGATRGPYLRTVASLDTLLTPVGVGGSVGRPDAPGWAGNVEYRQERFPDENRVEELRAWLMAPILQAPGVTVRAGYGFVGADSRENTFEPVDRSAAPDSGSVPGRYVPVYTPRLLQSHSIRVDLRVEEEGAYLALLDGALGFFAEEEAPVLFPSVPGVPEAGVDRLFRQRSFTPWHLRVRVRIPLVPEFVVRAEGGYRVDAFRRASFLGVSGTFFGLPTELE